MSDLYQLIETISSNIELLGVNNNNVSIRITLEAIISQNSFIVSLWQIFITIHFAIIACLFSYKDPINNILSIIFIFSYIAAIYVNYSSLLDAYQMLDALQKDLNVDLSSYPYLKATKKYFEDSNHVPLKAVTLIYLSIVIACISGLLVHTKFHKNNLVKKASRCQQKRNSNVRK